MVDGQLDELTGAHSRGALTLGLRQLDGDYRSAGGSYAVAMLDVDHLKTVNDVYGHAAGDVILQTVVKRAQHALRAGDRIYRYGGDEFVILLPGTNHAEATTVLRRLRDNVTGTPIDAGHRLTVTVSVGVAASDELPDADSSDTLLRADKRLYHAKRGGRNSVVADERSVRGRSTTAFGETRLYGRDEQLAQVDSFLERQADDGNGRVLRVTGPRGVGLSRFIAEVAIRAGLSGRAVRHLELTASFRSLHLRALELAYSSEISADASVAALTNRLVSDAEQHGLVILLEGGEHLDPASRRLISERLERSGTWLVEAVAGAETAAFTAADSVQLEPLVRKDVLDWLSAATVGPLEVMTGNALFTAGAGLPGRLSTLTARLLENGELKRTPVGLTGDAAVIAERAAELELQAQRGAVHLPLWDTPLVGRNRFLELVRPTAAAARLVVLTGPGGVGKSRLAAQLALELSSGAADGTDWLDLRAVTEVRLLPRMLANSLGLDPFDELERITAQLNGQQRLIMVDEADGIADAAGVFSDLLAQVEGLRLIVTSRMPLRLPEETIIEVPELQVPAAQELFRQGMQRQRSSDVPADPEIGELLERIGFSPLSIELASAWTRVYTVQELSEALDERPELLVDAPGLQPRTQRFIEVTRQLMSEQEQEALGILALVPAGFTAESAQEAAGASPFFLLALLERALLRREGNRYTVHAAIAERYRAGLRDPVAARLRIVTAWSQLAARLEAMGVGLKTLKGYRVVDEEERNFRFAWQELLQDPQAELMWPLVQVLRGYMDVRSRRKEALAMFSAADLALADSPDLALRGWVRESRALFLVHNDQLDEAQKVVHEALALLEEHGEPVEATGLAWNTAGYVYARKYEDEQALDAFKRSAELRAALGDLPGEAQALGNAALILADMQRPEEALTQLDQAVKRYYKVNHHSGAALTLLRKAQIMRQHAAATPEDCLAVAKEAYEIVEEIGYTKTGVATGTEVAEILIELNRLSEASSYLIRAAEWARADGDAEQASELLARAAELTGSAGQLKS